jgi:hypothetical protein
MLVDSSAMTSAIQDVSVEFKYDRGIHLEHANTYYDNGIKTIQLQFISQDLIEMCEARELIVDLTEALLARINQDGILGQELAIFPFSPYNLEIYITFESYFGKFVDPMYIAWIGMEDAEIYYYTFDPLDNSKNCWHSRHETYSTSREIVVYQREAEKKYDDKHPPFDVFGSMRYIPPDED